MLTAFGGCSVTSCFLAADKSGSRGYCSGMATISQPSPTPRLTLRRLFGNLPLPPGQVTGVAVMFFLGRTSPRSLPGPDLLHRMVGSGLLVIGGGLNAWALAERGRRSTGSFNLERLRNS